MTYHIGANKCKIYYDGGHLIDSLDKVKVKDI